MPKDWADAPEEIRERVIKLETVISSAMEEYLETEEDLEWAEAYFSAVTINDILIEAWEEVKDVGI